MKAGRRLACLQARIAQNALLGLAGVPVEVSFFIRTAGDAHPPGAALLLADEHDAVLAALIDRPGGAGGHAAGVQTMIADARQIEEDHPLQLVHLLALLGAESGQVRVIGRVDRRAAQVIVPVGTGLDRLDGLAGDQRDRPGSGLIVPLRRVEQILVIISPGLVIIIYRGQIGVEEDVSQCPAAALQFQPQLGGMAVRPGALPAALVLLLVFPEGRITRAGLGFHVIPPHVFGAFAVGPNVLAGHTASMAADAFIQVEDHRNLGSNIHSICSFSSATFTTPIWTACAPRSRCHE